MVDVYRVTDVTSTAVTGRYLAHNRLDPIERAFLAHDLYTGAKVLVNPVMTQCASLARANETYAWWAHHRSHERAAIIARIIPLVPPRLVKVASVPAVPGEIDQAVLIDIIRLAGIDRTLEAAAVVEAAQ
jgi:hypothetical protein